MNLREILITTTLIVTSISPSLGQSQDQINVKELESKGEEQIDNGQWIDARETYKELVKAYPENNEYNFLLGLSIFKSGIEREKSVDYLKKVNHKIIEESGYFYGQALLYDGQFDQAISTFKEFKPLIGDNKDGVKLRAEVNNMIRQAQDGKTISKNVNEQLRVDNLGEGINTEKTEYAPVVYQDQKFLVFSATKSSSDFEGEFDAEKEADDDIYTSGYELLDDNWKQRTRPEGLHIPKSVNTPQSESGINFSADKRTFYFYRNTDLYASENGGSPVAQKVEVGDLTDADMTAIYTNKEANTRFMVANLPESGSGGLDIYISKNEGGSWSNWKPMDGINTPYDEDSPYLAEDGTLYFSSKGHNSMGGHDLFKATEESGSWKVDNLGVPINSTGNDIHLVPADDKGQIFYLASDRKGGYGNMDIYRLWTCKPIEESTIKGKLLAEGKPLSANLTLANVDGEKIETIEVDNKSGDYNINVEPGKAYSLVTTAENYLNDTIAFSIPEQCIEYDLYQKIELSLQKDKDGNVIAQNTTVTNALYDIEKYRDDQSPEEFFASLPDGHRLQPDVKTSSIELDEPILLAAAQFKDVRFGFDSDEINGTAKAIVEKVGNYLNDHDKVTVKLTGHTDTKGPSWYNKMLSKRRAKSVSSGLEEMGIGDDRITIDFKGEEQPIVEDYDEEGNYIEEAAAKNRRVDIEVIIPEEKEVKEDKTEKSNATKEK